MLTRSPSTEFSQSPLLPVDKNVTFFLVQEGQFYMKVFISRFQEEEIRMPNLHLLCFMCLQLKIIFMPKIAHIKVIYSVILQSDVWFAWFAIFFPCWELIFSSFSPRLSQRGKKNNNFDEVQFINFPLMIKFRNSLPRLSSIIFSLIFSQKFQSFLSYINFSGPF